MIVRWKTLLGLSLLTFIVVVASVESTAGPSKFCACCNNAWTWRLDPSVNKIELRLHDRAASASVQLYDQIYSSKVKKPDVVFTLNVNNPYHSYAFNPDTDFKYLEIRSIDTFTITHGEVRIE